MVTAIMKYDYPTCIRKALFQNTMSAIPKSEFTMPMPILWIIVWKRALHISICELFSKTPPSNLSFALQILFFSSRNGALHLYSYVSYIIWGWTNPR